MSTERINPPELFDSRPAGFSQVVVSTGGCQHVHMSGQVAWNAEREIVGPDDMYRQMMQSLDNIRVGLRYTPATMEDVVALRIYIKHSHIHESDAVSRALHETFGDRLPSSTWIGVPSLAKDEFLVEIEPTIVTSNRSGEIPRPG